MIKKIFLLLLVLIVCVFLVIFYLIDKIFIKKYIKNLEDNLNINITLKEPHDLKITPNLSLLAKFSLEKNNKIIFFNDGELKIQKDYNLDKPFFNFNSKNIKIDKFILNNLSIFGEINEYNLNNVLKLTLFPEGYLSFDLKNEDKQSLQFVNIVIQRLNILKAYKALSNLFFNYLNDKSYFTSKVIYDNEYIYIDSFKVSNNDYNIKLVGKYDLKNEFVNIQSIVEIENEKMFEINTLGNLDNLNINILSMDKTMDMNFNMNDISQILSGNYEDFFQNLLINE
tara:strand:- start:12 stop:860 length:849 start_codon:yes stop_codon:yes gene_type:complete